MDSVHKLGGCCSGSGEGDSISIPETKEVGLSTIGFDSLDEVDGADHSRKRRDSPCALPAAGTLKTLFSGLGSIYRQTRGAGMRRTERRFQSRERLAMQRRNLIMPI
jgi:hypothetical protein